MIVIHLREVRFEKRTLRVSYMNSASGCKMFSRSFSDNDVGCAEVTIGFCSGGSRC